MSDDISKIMKCLTLSVQDNEITNLQSLSWAINKLEGFSMTFDTLESSRIGQTLQSVRHSKKISQDISERIRNLIKCWRRLLNSDCVSVTPNEMIHDSVPIKTVITLNGIKNGFVKTASTENIHRNLNGINHIIDPIDASNKSINCNIKSSDCINENINGHEIKLVQPENCRKNHDLELNNHANETNEDKSIDVMETALVDGSVNVIQSKTLGKPKLKSTKELLADFSSVIDADTQNKILMNKITQEDDDPTSYHPEEFKLRQIIQQQIYRDRSKLKSIVTEEYEEDFLEPIDIDSEDDVAEVTVPKRDTKCNVLIQKFVETCSDLPSVVFQPMVSWRNLKRGIKCAGPQIRLPKLPKPAVESANPFTINDIDELLQTFEIRAQRKSLITEAIQKRKETQIVDNTQSIADLSLKLKLKIPQDKILKLKIKKRKKRKKKKKLKSKKMPPPKPVVKKPRKPRIKPKPPITNFLDDLPTFPPITEDLIDPQENPIDRNRHPDFLYSEENVRELIHGSVEGYNCTRHSQTMKLIDLREMYSLLVGKSYLHVFPWVDMHYPSQTTFSKESDEIIQSALDLPQLFS